MMLVTPTIHVAELTGILASQVTIQLPGNNDGKTLEMASPLHVLQGCEHIGLVTIGIPHYPIVYSLCYIYRL